MRPYAGALAPAYAPAVLLALPALVLALLLPSPARAAAGEVRLLAHGSAEQYWIARVHEDVEHGGGFLTDVYLRTAGDSARHQVARVEGRAVDLAERGDQLALLLDGGGWLLVSDETVATGRALPWGARMLSVAPRRDTLLALARVYQPPPAPSTAPAPPGPATRPSQESERLVIFALAPDGWAEAGTVDVSGPLPEGPADVSLAVVEGTPLVAVREGPASVTIYRQANGAAPATAVAIEAKSPLLAFKLLGGGPVPVLWTVGQDGAQRLHWLLQNGLKTVDIPAPAASGSPGPVPAAATYAIERIRVVSGGGLALTERVFDALSGAPSGGPAPLKLPRTPIVPPAMRFLEPLLTVLLLFTIVASLRRRREMQETMQTANELPLAPFGRRFVAGAIDAAPLAASAALIWFWEKQADDAGGPWFAARSQVALLAGVVTYLLHTTVSEIAFGRTIGKAACGLKVVGLDGGRASPAALLTRNVLRLIDLSMVLFPLILVLYSPLRQRAGDVAAGTLVVLDLVGPEPVGEDQREAEASEAEKAPQPAEVGD